jgi:IS5 family transposase
MDGLRERRFHPQTVGLDKGYDTRDLVARLRAKRITPHVAQNTAGRRSAIDGRTTRHAGYGISQRIRMKVEEIFGWVKTVGGLRKMRYRGLAKVDFAGYLVGAAYNLSVWHVCVTAPAPA